MQSPLTPSQFAWWYLRFYRLGPTPPTMLRWDPIDIPAEPTDIIDGLITMAANGSANGQAGIGIHVYVVRIHQP